MDLSLTAHQMALDTQGVASRAVVDALTGAGATDLAVAARALGRSPEPGSVQRLVLAAALCRAIGATTTLERIQAGDTIAVCLGDHRSVTPLGTIHAEPQGTVSGRARRVPGAADASVLLVVATAAGAHLVAAIDRADAQIEPVPTLGDDGRADVSVDRAPVTTADVVGHPGALPAVFDRVRLALAAEMAGAAQAALASAVQRSRTRIQFGRPIGEFQAVAHRLADAAIDLTTVTDAVFDAADALDRQDPGATFLIAGAKALANDACRRITASAHQVWGAEGIYADLPLHRWHRRVQALVSDLGTTGALHRYVGAAALAQTGTLRTPPG